MLEATADEAASHVEIFGSRVSRSRFVSAELNNLELTDSIIEDCDLSGVLMMDARMMNVRFVRCRMTGVVITTSNLMRVEFAECHLGDANFAMSKLQHLEFSRCEMQEIDFSNSILDSCEIKNSRLQRAQFAQAKVSNLDLRGSELDDLQGVKYLSGATIGSDQVMSLASPLLIEAGIRVDDQS